ncbi:MAG: GIN domain-containing protein [Candidatus Cryptobacteroides sp.]
MKPTNILGRIMLSICAIILATSCFASSGNGPAKTITIPVAQDYTDLELSSAIQVVWSETATEIELTAPEKVIDKVIVQRTGKTLKIYLKGSVRNSDGKISVVLPASAVLDEISLSGASSFTSSTPLNLRKLEIDLGGASSMKADINVGGELEIDCSGASTMKGNVEAGSFSIDLSGASSAKLSGNVGRSEIEVSGASSLNPLSKPLVTSDTKCEISGASNVRIDSKGRVSGTVSGASSLRYGNEAVLGQISCTGASTVRPE